MKISLHGIPLYPKGHTLVRYGLVPTNYDMLMAESSSFILKGMQPRTWWVISVKGLSGKQFFSKFEFFFPLVNHIKWCHTKVLHFFIFFKLVRPDLGPTWNDGARKLPLVARRCGVSLFFYCLVKTWHVADPKMIFTKNQEVYFLALKCKTTLVPAKSAGTCAKFKKYLWRLSQRNES
jgi:hypothetical protein